MTALGKLLRTTAFKLSLVYFVLFALGSALVIGNVAANLRRLFDEQIAAAIDAEIQGLAEQYSQGGVRLLVYSIEGRTRRPGSSLYLVATPQGQPVVGNVAELPPGVLDRAITGPFETDYQRPDDQSMTRRAMARVFQLPSGFRLLVGRDLENRETLNRFVQRALVTSVLWLIGIATLGGLIVAWRVLRRVDGIAASTRRVMQGDLRQRLPLSGSNDEFDRLAQSVNAMIARIDELMAGLREVTDNIAHDLKTPLTRLRSRAEEALRLSGSSDDYRSALEKVIEESDQLIRVFNALLMIARAEAGAEREHMTQFDVAEVVRDVAELYEPLAENAGVTLALDAAGPLPLRGVRELVGQALANLVDNALKYGAPEQGDKTVSIRARRLDGAIELTVADRGPGVPAADRIRVLDRFVRLESSRSRPGSGLGLSLAAAVARLHNGELRIEDNEPGMRVVIVIPETGVAPARETTA